VTQKIQYIKCKGGKRKKHQQRRAGRTWVRGGGEEEDKKNGRPVQKRFCTAKKGIKKKAGGQG